MNESLTSFCGLCCIDCIPSREEFFTLVYRLDEMLGELQFEHYAELKSETICIDTIGDLSDDGGLGEQI
jgi:hypothetical protein